jgi:putative ABC transport system permease protein
MARLLLFYRLMVRPLFREPARTGLTVFAVALGVAVVLAIDLAGNAATGSFRSSMETLAGDNDLEITASGGIPESVMGTLAALPYPLRISPRIEDYGSIAETKQSFPLIGLDFISEAGSYSAHASTVTDVADSGEIFKHLGEDNSVLVGASLGRRPGDQIPLLINDQVVSCTVRGVFPDADGNEAAVVMDLAAAQRVLNRFGRLDRILVKVPPVPVLEVWQQRLRTVLPPGVEVHPQGTGTQENRQMLGAFRWNLRLLSYIAVVVGAFLIYNTISVSVVRRRADIGVVRALGASRVTILSAFVGEAACFGLAGAALGIPLGRLMAAAAVKLMSATVQALYVSSRPGPLELDFTSILSAVLIGVGVSVASAYSPAREASQVPPVEAMARGRREYTARVQKTRDLWLALALAVAAGLASLAPPIGGKPIFGYFAALFLVISSALAIPAFVDWLVSFSSSGMRRILGVEALLASCTLAASLRRTSVLVGALSTAVAMMTAVGIMVGSFRETVVLWMNGRLPADLYIRPAGPEGADRHPSISLGLAEKIAALPGVAEVDRLRAYEITYEGLPVELAAVDLGALRSHSNTEFFSGRPSDQVLAGLRNANAILVSEPFTSKHHARAGDLITLSLGACRQTFRVLDIYYEYGNERGTILMDRAVLMRYLPDPAPSNLAVYVSPGFSPESVRAEIEQAASGHRILIFSNRDLRSEAVRIFDRTFAITYALEAVAILVAVMGIAGALLALVIDRRRELGLLRFLGAASRQVRKLILVEAGLLGLFANFAGVALGFALSLILIYVINKQSFGWTIRFHWPVAVLLSGLSFVYAATLLAGFYPARVAVQLNPIEVIHEE